MLPDDISEAEKYEPFKRMTDENQRQQYFDLCVEHTQRVLCITKHGYTVLRGDNLSYTEAESIVRADIQRVTGRPFARKA